MKKVVFSLILIGTIIVSSVVGYAEDNKTAEKKGDLGTVIFSLNLTK
ncbi:hypothetical protein SAMN05421663_102234 [Terribacillus halophilus]|uniref:Uncharacterized protein n=1 Tax=Terribacillus halophilus TaxID=361279 RepID=A0A1G6L2H6_9BACI|nr:hypothetical protein [Terribacillus halophilus]SDC37540.1 hypothetical protein SAMN05421663_102234 [Terribacillus halophilus]